MGLDRWIVVSWVCVCVALCVETGENEKKKRNNKKKNKKEYLNKMEKKKSNFRILSVL